MVSSEGRPGHGKFLAVAWFVSAMLAAQDSMIPAAVLLASCV
jgi:hypothetical protein